MTRNGRLGWLRGSMMLLVLAMGMLGFTQNAAAGSWMAGASLGQTKIGDYELEAEANLSFDDEDSGWRAYGGYQVSYFGVTFGYVDLGALTASGTDFGGFTDKIEADGWDVQAIGFLSLGSKKRFHLFANLGLLWWEQKVTYQDASGPFEASPTGTSPAVGVGFDALFGQTQAFALNINWTRYLDVGDLNVSGHENDRDLIGIGVTFRFGL